MNKTTEQVDFYILQSEDNSGRYRFLARLVEKISRLKGAAFIQAANEQEANYIDRYLWEFRPDAFIPHNLAGQLPQADIVIGWQIEQAQQQTYINLGEVESENLLQFKRIVEIVTQEKSVLKMSRKRYKFYENAGISINMHDMRSK